MMHEQQFILQSKPHVWCNAAPQWRMHHHLAHASGYELQLSAARHRNCRTHCAQPAQVPHPVVTAASGLQQETVIFSDPDGNQLVGTLVEPSTSAATASASGLAPVLILVHGWMSHRNTELLVRLATALARSGGLASLRFDLAGNGDSAGPFRYGRYKDDAAQVHAAKLCLQARGRQVIGLLGHSKGATAAVLYASIWDDVLCVVNLAGRFHVREGVMRRLGERVLAQLAEGQQVQMQGHGPKGTFTWTLTQEDLQERLSTDMAAATAQIRHSRVLTIHGSADADVPVSEARAFDAAIATGLHELCILEGADHCFSEHTYQLVPKVVEWLHQA